MTRRSTDDGASEADAASASRWTLPRRAFLGAAGGGLALLATGGGGFGYFLSRVNEVGSYHPAALRGLRNGAESTLFRRHPHLADSVPWRPLGRFPTPVEPLPLPHGASDGRLYVKRDDLSSDLYGGNKVRKLEHFLAEAELGGHSTLVSIGGTGTNHGLATALHGRRLGFDVELLLFPQPPSAAAQRTHAEIANSGARVHYRENEAQAFLAARRVMIQARERGESPYFINVGGSSRLGTVGFVDAAFELAQQVRDGELPEPDTIFVALGTCGTAGGLLAGLRLAGLGSRVHAVRVTATFPANRFMTRHFARDVAGWLQELDPSLPSTDPVAGELEVSGEHRGPGYGIPTAEAETAVEWASPRLELETTYTGKTLAACLHYCRSRMAPGETVLFWNTFDSAER